MKIAKVSVVTIDITCPCGSQIPNPESGSLNWELNAAIPPSVVCDDCGETLKIPLAQARVKIRKIGAGEYSIEGLRGIYYINKSDNEKWSVTYKNYGDVDYWRNSFNTKKECIENIHEEEKKVTTKG